MLFHDIYVHTGDFGVWLLWSELRQQYPAFDFVHGYGLGVLAVGADVPTPVAALCQLTDPAAIATIRTRFARLGERWWVDTLRVDLAERDRALGEAGDYGRRLEADLAERDRALGEAGDYGRRLEADLAERDRALGKAGDFKRRLEGDLAQRDRALGQAVDYKRRLQAELAQRGAEVGQLQAEVAQSNVEARAARQDCDHAQAELRTVSASLSDAQRQIAELDRALAEAHAEQGRLHHELAEVLHSTFWQLTGPARRVASVLPPGLRRQGRRGARVVYWILTPHRTPERVAYFRARREAVRLPPLRLGDPLPTESSADDEASEKPTGAEIIEKPTPPENLLPAGYTESLAGAEASEKPTGAEIIEKPTPPENLLLAGYTESSAGAEASEKPTGAEIVEKPTPPENLLLAGCFDADWYVGHYGDVDGTGLEPFEHFLRYGAVELRDPNPAFDSAWYLNAYPDVRRTGHMAFEHFLFRGAQEGRSPFRDFDFHFYRAQAGIEGTSNIEAYRHYLESGRVLGIPTCEGQAPATQPSGFGAQNSPPIPTLGTLSVPLQYGKALYLKRCELSVFRLRTEGAIYLATSDKAFFSIVIPVFNKFNYNIRVLELLEHAICYTNAKKGIGIEVVVIDDGSTDETMHLDDYVKGIVLHKVSPNIGFLRACNLGASIASGVYLVFLNNDVEFEPDIFGRLYDAIERDKEEVACFGGVILQFDGSIQDLGSGIWRGGEAQGYFRNEPPTRYAYAYPRDVDYVAGCFFCISAADFHGFGGFDECFSPGYYEESDLSLRLWEAGRRSRVYPDIRLYHLEYGTFSAEAPRTSVELMTRNKPIFAQRHQDFLAKRPEFKVNAPYPVRYYGTRLRLLFVEDRLPSLQLGAGFGRSEIMIRNLLELADIDIFACHPGQDGLTPDGFQYIDVTYGPDPDCLRKLLCARHYDAVYVCRPHNMARFAEILQVWRQNGGKIVYDSEAVYAVRDVARLEGAESYAAITASAVFEAAVEAELRPAALADVIIAVNENEAKIVQRYILRPILTIGHHLPVRPIGGAVDERSGLLFVGGLVDDLQSPNYDSVIWFLDHVWPRIRTARPAETLRIAGYVDPEVALDALYRDGVVCLGPVPDLTDEYARARAFIAPTRFAAGVPFKVHESFSYGLPVVSSRLIGEQLVHGGKETNALLTATVNDDGQEFANACLKLLSNDELWLDQSQTALAYIKMLCAPSALRAAIQTLLAMLEPRAEMQLAAITPNGQLSEEGAAFRPASAESQNRTAGRVAELFHPPGHHYSPIVNISEIADEFRRRAAEPAPASIDGIFVDLAKQRNLWSRMVPLFQEIPFRSGETIDFRYYFDNENYSYGDGSVLYAMLRLHRPKRLIEVGSGYSSACSMDTIERYLNGEVKVTFIDPYPKLLREMLGEETIRRITLHEQRVQDVPLPEFDTLENGDVLFIDSTHVIKTGSDVCRELFEIIPRLTAGVLIHFHDMFWPFEYPEDWVLRENRSWNELYGMRAFLMHNDTVEIVFFNDYFRQFEVDLIKETYPLFLKNPGGSLWLRKV